MANVITKNDIDLVIECMSTKHNSEKLRKRVIENPKPRAAKVTDLRRPHEPFDAEEWQFFNKHSLMKAPLFILGLLFFVTPGLVCYLKKLGYNKNTLPSVFSNIPNENVRHVLDILVPALVITIVTWLTFHIAIRLLRRLFKHEAYKDFKKRWTKYIKDVETYPDRNATYKKEKAIENEKKIQNEIQFYNHYLDKAHRDTKVKKLTDIISQCDRTISEFGEKACLAHKYFYDVSALTWLRKYFEKNKGTSLTPEDISHIMSDYETEIIKSVAHLLYYKLSSKDEADEVEICTYGVSIGKNVEYMFSMHNIEDLSYSERYRWASVFCSVWNSKVYRCSIRDVSDKSVRIIYRQLPLV